MIRLVLPLTALPLSQNDQRRAHWTKVRDAKAAVELVVHQAVNKAKLTKIEGPVSVRLVWYAKDLRRRDVDSLGPMIKACLDALTKEGILHDDNSAIVHEVHLGPIIIARDNPRFELVITQLAGTGPELA